MNALNEFKITAPGSEARLRARRTYQNRRTTDIRISRENVADLSAELLKITRAAEDLPAVGGTRSKSKVKHNKPTRKAKGRK